MVCVDELCDYLKLKIQRVCVRRFNVFVAGPSSIVLRSQLGICEFPYFFMLPTFAVLFTYDIVYSTMYFREVILMQWLQRLSSTNVGRVRFLNSDGNRKRTFRVPGQWCLPDFNVDVLVQKQVKRENSSLSVAIGVSKTRVLKLPVQC